MTGVEQTAKQPDDATPVDRENLTLPDLARAILARQFRPRVGEIRRLAQAVLDRAEKKKKKKSGGETRRRKKLAKIPGQKSKR